MFKKKKKVNVFVKKLEPKVFIEKHQRTYTIDDVPTVGEPVYEIKVHTVNRLDPERLELAQIIHLTQPEMRALISAIDEKYPVYIQKASITADTITHETTMTGEIERKDFPIK